MLDGVDTFLCWPAGGGKTHLMRILASMFPRCLSLVICPLTLARELCHEVHEALGQYAQVTWGFRVRTAYVFGGTNQYDWDETTLLGAPAAPPYRSAAHATPTHPAHLSHAGGSTRPQ